MSAPVIEGYPRRVTKIIRAVVPALAVLVPMSALPAHAGTDGNYSWAIIRNECVTSGGKFGLGYLGIRAGNRKQGKIGVNYLKVRYERQYLTFNGGWRVDRTQTAQSPVFPNDNAVRFFAAPWRFPFSESDVGKVFRMKVSYSWYKQNLGPDIRKKHVVEYGPSCSLADPISVS